MVEAVLLWSVILTFDIACKPVVECHPSDQHLHGSQPPPPSPVSSLALGLALSTLSPTTPASPPHSSSQTHPLPHHPGCLHPPAD